MAGSARLTTWQVNIAEGLRIVKAKPAGSTALLLVFLSVLLHPLGHRLLSV